MNRKKVIEYLQDNWHLVMAIAAVALSGMNLFVPAAITLAAFIIVDFISTATLRKEARELKRQVKSKLMIAGSVVRDKVAEVPESVGEVLSRAGDMLQDAADDIRD